MDSDHENVVMETLVDLPGSLKICKPFAMVENGSEANADVKIVVGEIAKLLQQFYDVQIVSVSAEGEEDSVLRN